MAEEKSAIQQFLDEANPKETPFAEREVQVEPPEEDNVSGKKEVEEDNLPFHKNPKVQRYIEKQVAKALEGVKLTREDKDEVKSAETPSELISALTAVIGNDTPEKQRVLKAFENEIKGIEGKAAEKAARDLQQRIQAQEEAESAEVEARREEIATAWEEIEDKFNVDLTSGSATAEKLDTEFRNFVRKISHKNADGEVDMFPDLVEAFAEFQDKNKRPTRAKELASRSMTRSSDASQVPKLKDNSWRGVEKFFSNLKG